MFLLAIEDLVHKGALIVAIFPSPNDWKAARTLPPVSLWLLCKRWSKTPMSSENHMLRLIMFLLAIEDLVHKGALIVAIFPSPNDLFQDVDVEEWSEIMETGATPPVDMFPWLKLLPQWLFNNYILRLAVRIPKTMTRL
jgi:hypothetical protein